MPAPKGSKNAKGYQDALVAKNRALVKKELARLKELRASFRSVTALSRALEKLVGISDVTLRRNKRYCILLEDYVDQQDSRSGYISRAEAELNQLRHKVTQLELQLSNARADNDRLRVYVSKINEPKSERPTSSSDTVGKQSETSWEKDRLRTYHLVNALVSRAGFKINLERRVIEDIIAIEGEDVVAGSNLAEPYIEWCKNEDRGGGS